MIVLGLSGMILPLLSTGFFSEPEFLDEVVKEQVQDIVSVVSNNPNPAEAYDIRNRLVIAGAGINMALREGQSANILYRSGWVFPNTSTPDKGGNTVIFGHRFRYLPPVSNTLYSLDKVNVGDKFYIIWGGVKYDYIVSEKKVIEPIDLSVLNQTDKSAVTIVTCFPLFSTKQRLVVIGELVK